MTRPRISVVVPTCGRPGLLRRCLDALLAQRWPHEDRFEILVVDDGHDDATERLVDALRQSLSASTRPALVYLRPRHGRGPAVARNTGWRAARGELIAFTDDDTIAAPDWLAAGEAMLRAQPEVVALGGQVRVPLALRAGQRPTDHERMTQGLETTEFVTANAFVRRNALERVGGFDERFTRAWREDSDLQFRLLKHAGPVVRCEHAVVLHPARPERWGVSLRQQRNAMFEALLYKKHPREYRERIGLPVPWNYYAIVGSSAVALLCAARGRPRAAALGATAATALIARFTQRRLQHSSRAPAHVFEMAATSALIPFLSVYWRLRGAWRYQVLFV